MRGREGEKGREKREKLSRERGRGKGRERETLRAPEVVTPVCTDGRPRPLFGVVREQRGGGETSTCSDNDCQVYSLPEDHESTLSVKEDSTGPTRPPLQQRLPGMAAADRPGQLSNVQAELKGGNALLQRKGDMFFNTVSV